MEKIKEQINQISYQIDLFQYQLLSNEKKFENAYLEIDKNSNMIEIQF